LSYQWRKNGVPIGGANEAILVVPRATSAEAGFYTLDAVNSGGRVTTNAIALTVDSNLLPSRITNLAIRSSAGGARNLIVGFAVGPGSLAGSKPILLRGLGPALSAFGVPGVLADPKLEVYSGSNRISENDDWGGNSQVAAVCASVGAFALSSAASKDAALYSPAIATGSYSAILTGGQNTTGVALAEIYDATPVAAYTQSTPRLINVSARTHVGMGADILIAGFAISGNSPKTVLIRAVGPGLAGFGVQGTLVNPKLELFSGTTKLNENDDWGGSVTLANLARNAGAFALSATSRDATLIVTLSPGSYTAQVSGVNNTTGISLVEIYEVP
jgi:hypothetical protein